MNTATAPELFVEPILQYPRLAAVGTGFLLTVDLKPQQYGESWAYSELEEIPIRCIINSGTLFRVEFLGEPVLIVHRYGGTYSPVRFLLTPEPSSLSKSGKVRITLANRFGVPMTVLETDAIVVQESVSAENLIAIARVKPPKLLIAEFKVVTVKMTKLFAYEVGKLEFVQSRNLLSQKKKELQINKETKQGQQLIEWLDTSTSLDMVIIPAGKFMMGAPKEEKESGGSERPQHEVSVSTFLMGKYPITQTQWRIVAAMPQVNRELNLPSNFKGVNRPVEQVSWLDAMEFCARLTRHTGREYRLPSEAEWEYACRAGTTTPFHFGETITTELVNYDGNHPYGEAPKGEYRKETTEVGIFPANEFGLHDMHGNVWEWCADDYYANHEGAPSDAQIRIKDIKKYEDPETLKLLRGGSWSYNAHYCRSAFRNGNYARNAFNNFGFRVVCVVR